MPTFRNFSLSAVTAVLLGFCISSSSAVEAIPESCLKCKGIRDDGEFVTCLYDCLASVSLEGINSEESTQKVPPPETGSLHSGSDDRQKGPDIEDWKTTEIHDSETGGYRRIALTESEDAFPFFFENVKPTLVLIKTGQHDAAVVIDVRPASVTGFGDRILIQVDKEKIRRYPLRPVWSGHAVLIKDKALIDSIRKGNMLAARLDIFGAGIQTISFDLKGSRTVLEWLDELNATRS